jgi:hypothetical protein
VSLMYEDAARQPDQEPTCQIGAPEMPAGHQGHHVHVEYNAFVCSCGAGLGCFSFVPDPRWWSDDPAVVDEVRREEDAWRASISCSYCGRSGVVAEEDWGVSA